MIRLKLIANKILPTSTLKAVKQNYREIRGKLLARRYRGNIVSCPCCQKQFRTFLPFGYTKGLNNASRFEENYKNTVCPYCYSLPRHRIVCDYLNKNKADLTRIKPKVLMIGAEHAIEIWLQKNNWEYTTADLFDRTADVKVDIQQIQFEDESWSLIICNHVLEHVPNYEIALGELRRILKKEGLLEISVPTDKSFETTVESSGEMSTKERIRIFGQIDHMRIFGKDIAAQIALNGFQVDAIHGSTLPAQIGTKIGPANYDDNTIYICRKSN